MTQPNNAKHVAASRARAAERGGLRLDLRLDPSTGALLRAAVAEGTAATLTEAVRLAVVAYYAPNGETYRLDTGT